MIKNKILKSVPLIRCSGGKIDESRPICLQEYEMPNPTNCVRDGEMGIAPDCIRSAKRVGNTVYDVIGCFDEKADKSLLTQFKEMILSGSHI